MSVEVKKSQHKYVIGPKGNSINEILADTGVFVEMPSSDSTSETITLRGPQDKLGLGNDLLTVALKVVCLPKMMTKLALIHTMKDCDLMSLIQYCSSESLLKRCWCCV